MIKVFFSKDDQEIPCIGSLENFEKGSWIHATKPNSQEIEEISKKLAISEINLKCLLDEEEKSRIEWEEELKQTLIIVNYPVIRDDSYHTLPLGIIIAEDFLLTISTSELNLLEEFNSKKIKNFGTYKKLRFVIQILYKIALEYMSFLREISKKINQIEKELERSTKNKALLKMLSLSKGLVYFSTALRGNQAVIERIQRVKYLKIYEEDVDLLEDTLIENKQSLEMSDVYTNIVASMMETYASIISNNLNSIMKLLTKCTILIMVPTFITSLYGMNVKLPLSSGEFAFEEVLIIASFCTLIAAIVVNKWT